MVDALAVDRVESLPSVPFPRRREWPWSIVVLCLVLVIGSGCGTATGGASHSPMTATDPVSVAKELAFTTRTVDGKTFDGRSLAGQPAVIWFWASWCPICASDAENAVKLSENAKNSGITFVTIDGLDSPEAQARQFVSGHSMTGLVNATDPTGEIWSNFGVFAQDSYALVRADGKIRIIAGSGLDVPDLTTMMQKLTA